MTSNDHTTDGPRAPGRAGFATAWVDASGHLAASLVEANRAVLAAFGLDGDAPDAPAARVDESTDETSPEGGVAYEREGWTTERTFETPGTLTAGDRVTFAKRLTDDDVRAFADASGDTNRLHLDEAFAAKTRFGERIVHGILVSGLVSAALARLPGLVIYLSQDLRFTAPVAVGDRVTAAVDVAEDLGDGRYRLATVVENEGGETVVEGEAVVLVEAAPDDA